ncbi:hypothetical protein EC396_02105 [Lutibacter sp. HS1-25]|uniref:hypothetical protein n=1 Tax=Lutibacter sp. HS1-25 TaxID=2485000 RepID=UPI001013335C|nr:hypothetical protein [Lutibacter sp. HS1-25]RXP63619.1 hypothetical protein EC396_02105 [Lutibacter sp. HS1-25]
MKNLKLIGFLMIIMSSFMFIQCTSDPIAGVDGKDGIDGVDGINGADGIGVQECVACHSDATRNPIHDAYAMSRHGNGSSWARGTSASCAQCHNNEGYIDYLSGNFKDGDGNQSANPVGYAVSNAITCKGCHTDHRSFDFANDGQDYAIRSNDPVKLVIDPSVVIDFTNNSDKLGLSNSCTTCHQPRNSYPVPAGTDPVVITSYRYGPHHSPQATLLEGIMGANIAGSTGYPGAGGSGDNTHRKGSSCTACHMGESADASEGGHTWKASEETCLTCHKNGVPSGVTDFDANLQSLHDLLFAKKLIDAEGYVLGDDGINRASTTNPLNASAKDAQAIWNYKTIEEDKSKGVHNPKYVKALLKNSIEYLQQ